MVNIKATVISWPNEYRRKQFEPYFIQLGNRAQKSHNERIKFDFVLSAIDFMRFVSMDMLPTGEPDEERFIQTLTVTIDGKEYTKSFELIKPLRKENIYELRIDFNNDFEEDPFEWHFRVIFFPYVFSGDLFHCFVYPFEKTQQVRFNLTDLYRDKAYTLYYDLLQNPGKYIENFK